jgi:hypothetical protein
LPVEPIAGRRERFFRGVTGTSGGDLWGGGMCDVEGRERFFREVTGTAVGDLLGVGTCDVDGVGMVVGPALVPRGWNKQRVVSIDSLPSKS